MAENDNVIVPKSLDEVVAAMCGFGLEEVEEIIQFDASGKTVSLRISNIPTEQEIKALLAAEEYKGYAWIQRIRCEILSRAVTWANGISIRNLTPEQRIVTDCTSKEEKKPKVDVQVVLRNIFLGWGQEVLLTLWKLLMVHSDKIEKRMQQNFPESTMMTEVERRLFESALKEIRDASKEVIEDTIIQAMDTVVKAEDKTEEKA
jgi:hypothetical protein